MLFSVGTTNLIDDDDGSLLLLLLLLFIQREFNLTFLNAPNNVDNNYNGKIINQGTM